MLVLALVLNKLKMRERVLVGEEDRVRAVLEGKDDSELLYDRERALGQFLLDWETETVTDWSLDAFWELREALRTRVDRSRHEEAGKTGLLDRAAAGSPIGVYTANRCWEVYCEQRAARGFQDRVRPFEEAVVDLTGDFGYRLLPQQRNYAIAELLEDARDYLRINGCQNGVELNVWYPWDKDSVECLMIRQNVLPAVVYYLHRLRDWGLCWCSCKKCGKWFLAPSRHHGLCSDGCRLVSGRENKRSHDAAVRDRAQEQAYKSCYQRLNKRIKAYCASGVGAEETGKARDAFAAFREEAKTRKKQVRTQEQADAYRDWLLAEERKLELLWVPEAVS